MSAPAETTEIGAQLLGAHLYRVSFKDDSTAADEGTKGVRAKFLLSCHVFDDGVVGTEFGVNMRTKSGVRALVIYRLTFRQVGKAEGFVPDDEFARFVASRLAPKIAFPFVREVFASLTAKAGEPMLLPLVNTEHIFDSAAIVITRDAEPTPLAVSTRAKPRRLAAARAAESVDAERPAPVERTRRRRS